MAGTPGLSQSRRMRKMNQAMRWEPGDSAWDYVAPLVQTGGLRLLADESRVWHLDASGGTVAGTITLAEGQNVNRASDTISMLDDSDFYDGVTIIYSWTDPISGQLRWGSGHGWSGRQALHRDHRPPLPWPGAAAILARSSDKGRVVEVVADSNYTTTPGMAVNITLPNVAAETGHVSAVEWSLPEGTMTVASYGLANL